MIDKLDKAQQRKIDLICRKLQLRPGDRFIDIGCGYGVPGSWLLHRYPETTIYGIEPEADRVRVAAMALGAGDAALDIAIQYAKERIVFGKPIAKFQAIQFMLADMAIQIEAARQLTYKTVAEIDRGNRAEAVKLGSMAKCFAADTGVRVATDALQVKISHT